MDVVFFNQINDLAFENNESYFLAVVFGSGDAKTFLYFNWM